MEIFKWCVGGAVNLDKEKTTYNIMFKGKSYEFPENVNINVIDEKGTCVCTVFGEDKQDVTDRAIEIFRKIVDFGDLSYENLERII